MFTPYRCLNSLRPFNIQVTFETIGGLEETVKSMKNIILLPLKFPELFAKFDIPASRGVLFHGPPGQYILDASHCRRGQ
jgi:ATP-dependent 26S proteasome regulatory subunit